jgi:hypothetical protein
VYEACREFYQVLSASYPPESHWVMKAPYHLLHLDHLVEKYSPTDTCLVFCHRDPIESVASSLSLWISMAAADWDEYNVIAGSRHAFDILVEVCSVVLCISTDSTSTYRCRYVLCMHRCGDKA